MIELSVEQEKLVSGGSVYSDALKVAELVAPNAVKAIPYVGTAVTIATAADLAYKGYSAATSDPAAAKAAQDKAIAEGVQRELQRMRDKEEQDRLDKKEDEFYERRLKEMENKRSEEGNSDTENLAGGPDMNEFMGGGGEGNHEAEMDSYENFC